MRIDDIYTIYTPVDPGPPDDYDGNFCDLCDHPSYGNNICDSCQFGS